MKLSERYIEKYTLEGDKGDLISVKYLEDLFVIKDLENIVTVYRSSVFVNRCKESLKEIATKHNLPYD